tara:strand:- start:942 stop:1310 length:369 start_codon:yes stop_codon:yes gene_type:complete
MADEGEFAKFESAGEDTVSNMLARGSYNPRRAALAQLWLDRRAAARSDSLTSEQLDTAKRANDAAWAAAEAARDSADAAREQAAEARAANIIANNANVIATLALIAATIAITVSIFSIFLGK